MRKPKPIPKWEVDLLDTLMAIHHDWPRTKVKARHTIQSLRRRVKAAESSRNQLYRITKEEKAKLLSQLDKVNEAECRWHDESRSSSYSADPEARAAEWEQEKIELRRMIEQELS